MKITKFFDDAKFWLIPIILACIVFGGTSYILQKKIKKRQIGMENSIYRLRVPTNPNDSLSWQSAERIYSYDLPSNYKNDDQYHYYFFPWGSDSKEYKISVPELRKQVKMRMSIDYNSIYVPQIISEFKLDHQGMFENHYKPDIRKFIAENKTEKLDAMVSRLGRFLNEKYDKYSISFKIYEFSLE